MENKKIGLIENSNGDKSHTKLIGLIVALCIMVGWVIVSGLQHRLVEIDPTLLTLLGICMTGNGLNKWVEANGIDKEKLIESVLKKAKE